MDEHTEDLMRDALCHDSTLYSVCCGSPPLGEVSTIEGADPIGICSSCHDHTCFEENEE